MSDEIVKPPDNRGTRISATMLSVTSGPLPPPEVFERYPAKVQAAILEMARKEQDHRHEQDRERQDQDWVMVRALLGSRKLGQWASLLVTMTIAGIAAYALYLGHPTAASVIIVSGMVPVAGLILASRQPQQKKEIQPDASGGPQQLPLPHTDDK